MEYARGHNITVKPFPKELTYFSLAKEFHWLPSQIDAEPVKKINGILRVLSVYNEIKNKEIKRSSRKGKK
jgi:hypothetical protein